METREIMAYFYLIQEWGFTIFDRGRENRNKNEINLPLHF